MVLIDDRCCHKKIHSLESKKRYPQKKIRTLHVMVDELRTVPAASIKK